MSGVIGFTSTKFLFAAGALCMQASVDLHKVRAEVDWNLPRSLLGPRLAEHLHRTGAKGSARLRPLNVGIGAKSVELPLTEVGTGSGRCGAVDVVIGQDLLEDNPLLLDVRNATLTLVLPYEIKDETKHMVGFDLGGEDGRWRVPVGTGAALQWVELDLADPGSRPSSPAVASIGPITVPVFTRGGGGLAMTIDSFAGRKVVLDFPHRRIWLQPR